LRQKTKILNEQPFDELLLSKSRLYRRSRELFLRNKGTFRAVCLSSARTLGSANLVRNEIEYNPIASELAWSLSDPVQRKDRAHLEQVRAWMTGVFHEQSHRILWHHFKAEKIFCPQVRSHAYRFLNLVESLVIILDMAVGDELDSRTGNALYSLHGIYNPGSAFMRKIRARNGALYRQALIVCLYVTYFRLEGLHPEDIPQNAHFAFENLNSKMIDSCIERSMKIEPRFVDLTNPIWQKKHVAKVMDSFRPPRGISPLELPVRKPFEIDTLVAIANNWLKLFSL